MPLITRCADGDVGVDVLAQVVEHLADRLELDPGVEQGLDDPQLEQILVAVPAPAAAPRGVAERRPDQVGARPVVELAVRDADHLGCLCSAEPFVHRPSVRRGAADDAPAPTRPAVTRTV